MIFLFTGLPGSFKTCSAIQFIHERFVEKEKRKVFAYGINALDLDGWTDLETVERAQNWWELPRGSVLVIDEAQNVMPQRGTGRPPQWIERLSEHRHSDKFAENSGALDIVLITQDAMMIDVFVRRLCNDFRHNSRPSGLSYAKVMRWEKVGDPDDYHFKKLAVQEYRYKPNKRFFSAYSSTTLHTVKRTLPWKKLGVLVASMAVVSACGYFVWGLKDKYGNSEQANMAKPAVTGKAGNAPVSSGVASGAPVDRNNPADLNSYVPRVASLPHTAPRYDDVTKPTTAPVPLACVQNKNRCTCYSQQGTTMAVSLQLCSDIVHRGFFLDFEPDQKASKDEKKPAPALVDSNSQEKGRVGPSIASMGSSEGEPGVRKPDGIRKAAF